MPRLLREQGRFRAQAILAEGKRRKGKGFALRLRRGKHRRRSRKVKKVGGPSSRGCRDCRLSARR